MKRKIQGPKSQQGVMLLEALVGILIFTVGIVAIMGLQAASIAQVTQSKYRTDASYLANQLFGIMWGDTANISSYTSSGGARATWDTTVANTLPGGTGTVAVVGPQVTFTINWKQPADPVTHKFVAVANINKTDAP